MVNAFKSRGWFGEEIGNMRKTINIFININYKIMNKILKIIFLFLMIPVLGVSQNKKELKEIIVQKNDSIIVFINQINQLDNKIKNQGIDITEFEGSNTKLLDKLHNEKEKNKNLTKTLSVLNQKINDLDPHESSKNIIRLLIGFENTNIDDSFIEEILEGEIDLTFFEFVNNYNIQEIDSISIYADSISISVDIYMKYIRGDISNGDISTHESIYKRYIDINHDKHLDLFQSINDEGHHWGYHSEIYLYDTINKQMVDMRFDIYPHEFCNNLGLEHGGEGYSRPYSGASTNGEDIWYSLNCYDYNSDEETHYILHYLFNPRINMAVYIDFEIDSVYH